jgi:hypothetical protein
LYRDKWCKVTSFTAAPITWPRVQPEGQRGGCGLWVDDTLARAVRTESVVGMAYWFGASERSVWGGRRWAGVGGDTGTRGTLAAKRAASHRAFPPDVLWDAAEDVVLGTAPDAVVSRWLGRSMNAAKNRRRHLRIPVYTGART